MIIVTGGAGFIGSNIVKALNDRGRTDILIVDDLTDGRKIRNIQIQNFQITSIVMILIVLLLMVHSTLALLKSYSMKVLVQTQWNIMANT